MRVLSSLINAILIMIAVPFILAQDVQISATVGSDVVGIDDQFQLTITISGRDSGNAENPRLPRLNGFKVVGGPNVSTQFQWINGRTSSSKHYIYILLPEKEGQFTIDPVEVRVGGRIYKTEPITVRVTSASTRRARSQPSPVDPFANEDIRPEKSGPSSQEVFIEAELDRASAYPGQQITLSYHLYTQVGITGLQLQENPPLSGFWVEDLQVEPNPTGKRKIINGKEYLEYVVKKQALFPTTTGKLKIPSSTFAISAKTTGDFFGMFAQTETIYRKTREAVLDVKPLPVKDRPENFSNAVGSFNLTSIIDKTQAATGEAVDLRIKLEGRGNLKMIPDIALPPMPDFTIYSSKRADNIRPFEENQIGGDKTWEYVIVPKAPGQQIIPSLSFSYFDAERQSYETLRTQPLTLKVTLGADSGSTITGLSALNKQNLTRQGTDINFIKLASGGLEGRSEPAYRMLWFYLIAAIPLAFNVGAYLYQKERSKESTNVVLTRRRKARRVALDRLRKAEKAGHAQPRRFYDEAAVALSGYLADRFNLPEIAVTGDSLERALAESSIASDTVQETVSCLQECDFGRFVSASALPDKMRALGERIRKIIDALEQA
jgi:hypothetical protein